MREPTTAISPAMRRYAAEIYRLQDGQPWVGLADLAAHAAVSAQAVSRMARRMKEAGLVEHQPYRGLRLTEAGQRAAMPAIRRHRLVEVFLVNVMGFDWSETHDLADVFEQGIDASIEDRIDLLTGHPTRCPHGDPIPTRDGRMPVLDDTSLVNLRTGERGVVSRVRTHDPERLRYLRSIGLVPGTAFDLRSCAPFNGPLRLKYGRHDEVLGHELATAIWVTRDASGEGG
ncbi:MAG: metal-dependent transcriptional regulator [Caldilineae bacterium]|nr:metal-dependent transcriptional regulator [Chloroflexota bacterium]MCB9176058.1 metal-dependent transcriptional regulator [Caldilineae bacterium]